MNRAALAIAASMIVLVTAPRARQAAEAMPVFAEAYGFDCQKCHVQVPALNSYGRYVQRTMYAALDRQTLGAILPFWVGESANGDTQSALEPHRVVFGNLAAHASGFIAKNVTTHVQGWIAQGDRPGGIDTAWISYDRIFGPNTHFVVGKMPPAGPSFFSQWMDLAPIAIAQIASGEHSQALASNRWGAKVGWSNAEVTADAGWYGSQADVNGATDFSSANDKAVQWHVAYAPVDRPIQVGLYGNAGSLPLSEGGVDHYTAAGSYLQLDPTAHAPGALFTYQRGWDGNVGNGLRRTATTGMNVELMWRPFHTYEGLLSIRQDAQSDGLGGFTHGYNLDLNARVARFVHATFETHAQSQVRPALRYQLWWTTPLQRAH